MCTFANDKEIEYAHSVLLKGKAPFDKQKKAIIKCNESKDIKACPGSGKTTTLLAKLVILANRMPLPKNQGICVLTHTNVAIEEIKSKLGNKADLLFAYPNHFGTIQSFIDKFVAIPYFKYTTQRSIKRIDDESAKAIAIKAFRKKTFDDKKCIFHQIMNRLNKGIENKEVEFNFLFNTWVGVNNTTGKKLFYKAYENQKKALASDPNTSTYTLIHDVRLAPFKEGILKYDDAYSFAFRYINEVPQLQQAISSRFKYLFIDEMQDTDKKQIDILDKLFDTNKTIRQRFGDHHQAIYNSIEKENLWNPEEPLPIDTSLRFGENIAKVLRTVCMEDNNALKANPEIPSLKPTLIVYKANEQGKVLPRFVEILNQKEIDKQSILQIANKERKEDKLHRHNIKAIGWVGKNNPNKTTIKSYFPSFNSEVRKKEKVNYDSLKSFLRRKEGARVKDYSDTITRALLHVLYLSDVRPAKKNANDKERYYNKTTFKETYNNKNSEEYQLLRENIARWSMKIHQNKEAYCNDVLSELKNFIKTTLAKTFKFEPEKWYVNFFLENISETISAEEIETNNLYSDGDIEIEVGTIHSVKGETHAATLYLETSFHNKHESERLFNQLKGKPYTGKASETIQSLKMAYVGMSRPRYLLCVAVQSGHLNLEDEKLKELWDIEHCE